MSCPHCLRGDAQKIDMSDETIHKAIGVDSYVNCVLITGGEPALAWRQIETIAEAIRSGRTEVGNWFVITNGKFVDRRFIGALRKLHDACSDNDISGLQISNDPYHDSLKDTTRWSRLIDAVNGFDWEEYRLEDPNLVRPAALKFRNPNEYYMLDPVGRALNMGNTRPINWRKYLGDIEDEEHDDLIMLYVNAKGELLTDCGMSYELQDKLKIDSLYRNGFDRDSLLSRVRMFDKKFSNTSLYMQQEEFKQ